MSLNPGLESYKKEEDPQLTDRGQPSTARVLKTNRFWSMYRGTSLIRKRTPLGLYRRPMPRVLGGFWGGGRFLMGEVPLYLQA